MCGIVGFTHRPDIKTLEVMANAIRHRGPDDKGYWESNGISAGMRRLSIVDLETGQQPIFNEDNTIGIVLNGEIYNHKSLRNQLELKGHIFRTSHSDTEVVIHLYEEYGLDFLQKLNGMFALALWDLKSNRLILARDRIGKKPLYYSIAEGNLIFASEIKAILAYPGVARAIDPVSIYQYLGLKNTSAPRTIYAQIKQLLPGHILIHENGGIQIKKYWFPDFSPLSDIGHSEARIEIRRLIEDSVRIRMDCDVPYGAYLSGGVDSSTVVSIMSKIHDRPIKTFCLGYADKTIGQFLGKEQDLYFAREMSNRLGTEHHEMIIDSDFFIRYLPDIIHAFDEPFSGTISTFFLSILIGRHVKVAISGDGADELFGSYLSHRLAFPIRHYLMMNKAGRTDLEKISTEDRIALGEFASPEMIHFLSGIANDRQSLWRDRLAVFSMADREKLLTPEFLEKIPKELRSDGFEHIESTFTAKDSLNQALEMDQRELLPNQILPFVDRLSMAHSIEVRCPFLDYRLVEFVNRLPGLFKINGGITKHILKLAVADLLPPDLINRPKEGFVQPIYTWMHTSLKSWVISVIHQLPLDIFQHNALIELLDRFQSGDRSMNAKIWNLVCFGLWYNDQIKYRTY